MASEQAKKIAAKWLGYLSDNEVVQGVIPQHGDKAVALAADIDAAIQAERDAIKLAILRLRDDQAHRSPVWYAINACVEVIKRDTVSNEQPTVMLWSGTPGFLGGLSNERTLAKLCPDEFKQDNKWSNAAMKIFFLGGSSKHWKHREEAEKKKRIGIFMGLLQTYDLSHEDKAAVAGWMLSEMLTECPEHVPMPIKK